MASLSQQARRIVVAGAFAITAAAAPVLAFSAAPAPSAEAAPKCLSWFGNKEDGNCLSSSNGNGVSVGSPNIGMCNGGICTGPLMPGNTWNVNVPVG